MKNKGFTLIELMVVIVIIGILSAVAIPKLFGMSAKAKVAEAPQAISSWSKLQEAYFMEKSDVGTDTEVGFKAPTESKNFTYTATAKGVITAALTGPAGDCKSGATWGKTLTATAGVLSTTWAFPTNAGASQAVYASRGTCALMTPNFGS